MKINVEPFIGGIAEVRILGERACGGIVGDIVVSEEKVTITFAKYVEHGENSKWVKMENHPMVFSNRGRLIDGNLIIKNAPDTVVVIHQSLEHLLKKY